MSNAMAEPSMMTRADVAELAHLATEIGSDLEAAGVVSNKLDRLAATLTAYATSQDESEPTDGLRWEYDARLCTSSGKAPQILRTMGNDGWELAAIAGDSFYFKRATRRDAA